MRITGVDESRPGRWVVTVVDGDYRVSLTFGWVEPTHLALPGIALIGVGTVEVLDEAGDVRRLFPGGLRDLPWALWERTARSHLTDSLNEVERRHAKSPLLRVLEAHPELGEATAQAERRRKAHLRLVLVADQYRRNVLLGLPDPVKAIADEWEVAPATARSWVYRARKEGYLEPHEPTPNRHPSTSTQKEES